MRFLLKATIPVENGNASVMDGSIMTKLQRYLGEVKPEAGYFFAENGQRAFHLIINIDRPEELVEKVEPLWLDLNASLEVVPVMNMEDFTKAGAGIQRVVQARM